MSRPAEVRKFNLAAERSDLFDGRQFGQDKVMRGSLRQVAASGAVIGIIVARQRVFMLIRIGTLVVIVARALAMMVMPGMIRELMTSMVVGRPMRVSPRCKQTVRQMQ